MKNITKITILLLTALFSGAVFTQDFPPLEFRRLSDRALLMIGGRESNNVVALSTERGIVVIDSGESPVMGRAIRSTAERELGRKDFAFLINTHDDWDHVQGNQVFADVPIIGHDQCAARMMILAAALEEAKSRKAPPARPRTEAAVVAKAGKLPPPPPVGPIAIDIKSLSITPPDVTFRDRMRLDLGDLRAQLYYFGRAHSRSDVLILIPEEKLLLVGDLFYKNSLPVFAGRGGFETERWLEVIDEVLKPEHGVEIIISGHGPPLDRAEFTARCEYVRELVSGIAADVSKGLTLEKVQERFDLERRFPELAPLDQKGSRGGSLHRGNVEAFWSFFKKR